VFGTGFNLINVILPALAIAIFSAASVVLIKPYVKGGVLPLFTILIAMVTTTPYFIIAMIDSKISDATAIFNSTFLIPFLTFAILGVVLFPFCFLQINFLKVKV
jgi:cytochrome bd-type quinol oxidase subunit 2